MEILGYECEWYDSTTKQVLKLYLKIRLEDNTIEILQETKKSPFLNRIYYPDISPEDLFIGNSVTIFNRILEIKAYANASTASYMSSKEVHYLCALHSDSLSTVGNLLNICKDLKLHIGRLRTCKYGIISSFSVSDGDVVIELVGFTASDSEKVIRAARGASPGISVEVLPVEDINGIMGTCGGIRVPANSTLCLIKPHVIRDGNTGDLLKLISESNFQIKGLLSFHFNLEMAEEFFGVYRGIFPRFSALVSHLCSGPLIAVLVAPSRSSEDDDVVEAFRELCGPLEPELARALRPNTIRARFGKDLIQNAVHCTDLPEDGVMEAKYVFETIADL